jgi:hypothetical protein
LGTEFRSEKIPQNRLGTVSVISRKKVLIPRHSEFRGRANSDCFVATKVTPRKTLYGCEVGKGRKRQRQMAYCMNWLSMAS